MRILVPTVLAVGFAALSCSSPQERNQRESDRPHVVELPRPNSGTFTFEEAGRRRAEIFEMAPSGMLDEWKNPFRGFSIHINEQDALTVYNSWLRGLPDFPLYRRGPLMLSSAHDLRDVIEDHEHFQLGNPLGVLVTSTNGGASKELPEVLDVLFVPSIQVYYLRTPNLPQEPASAAAALAAQRPIR